jgi:hypothetical protein
MHTRPPMLQHAWSSSGKGLLETTSCKLSGLQRSVRISFRASTIASIIGYRYEHTATAQSTFCDILWGCSDVGRANGSEWNIEPYEPLDKCHARTLAIYVPMSAHIAWHEKLAFDVRSQHARKVSPSRNAQYRLQRDQHQR